MPERWEQSRKTKKDKARRNEEIYGKYSPKHVRMSEALAENGKLCYGGYVKHRDISNLVPTFR